MISFDQQSSLDSLLFGGPINSAWAQDGYNSWSDLNSDMQLHDTFPQHRTAGSTRISWLYGHIIKAVVSAASSHCGI